MSYRLEILPRVRRKLASWKLDDYGDGVLVEAYLFLERLKETPWDVLQRSRTPFDGMTARLAFVDPANRLCEHVLIFHVFFGMDEESWIVANAIYRRRVL